MVLKSVPYVLSSLINNTADAVQYSEGGTFFTQFVVAGGPIVWFILLPMSALTVYLFVELSITTGRERLLPAGIAAEIATAVGRYVPDRPAVKVPLKTDLVSCAWSYASSKIKGRPIDEKTMRHLFAESLQRQGQSFLQKIEWLNIIGNVAPMVGLLGTVYGMIKAFVLLGVSSGQPSPAGLASAISIALVTTFWGLVIAIPALVMYSLFRNRVELLTDQAAVVLDNLLRQIRHSAVANLPAGLTDSKDRFQMKTTV